MQQPLMDSSSTPSLANVSIFHMPLSPNSSLIRTASRGLYNSSPGSLCAEVRGAAEGERGAGHLKAIIFTLILASLVYVAVKVIPILVNEYEFQDGVQTLARFASVNRQPVDKLRESILKEAEKDNVPVQPEDIKVEGAAGNVRIQVDYSVTVDLAVYQWTLNFHPKVSNDALF